MTNYKEILARTLGATEAELDRLMALSAVLSMPIIWEDSAGKNYIEMGSDLIDRAMATEYDMLCTAAERMTLDEEAYSDFTEKYNRLRIALQQGKFY